jgi:hypothetical protein
MHRNQAICGHYSTLLRETRQLSTDPIDELETIFEKDTNAGPLD